jgi:hypothetical protein
MKTHRHPRTSLSNQLAADNFDPAAALESLHTEIVDIEALAHAAGEAVTLLPRPADPEQRRHLARIYTLVTKLASEISTTVSHGDDLIAALGSHLASGRMPKP